MKRLFVLMTAVLALVAFSSSAFAANQVQLTLTSPTIYKTGCEKAGSVTFSFDAGSKIEKGDWWYMDLPANVTLCKTIDYVIAESDGVGAGASDISLNASLDYTATLFNSTTLNITDLVETDKGPLTVSKVEATPSATSLSNGTGSSNVAFLVKGVTGQRRVALYALTDAAFTELTVNSGWKMNIKILDGASHSNLTAANGSAILLDSDADGIYGEVKANNKVDTTKDEVIGGSNASDVTVAVPYIENTLCVNASTFTDSVVMTSYASRNDKFTFTGDAQIAHTAATGAIALKTCVKYASTGDIKIAGQGSTCTFDYDTTPFTGANAGYCTTPSFVGNRLMIEAAGGAFGDIDDTYDVTAQILTPGVYFGGAFTTTVFKSTEDECSSTALGTTLAAKGTTYYVGSAVGTKLYAPTNTCTIPTDQRVDKVTTTGGSFDLDNYDTIWVDFATFAYDQSLVSNGTEIKVKLTLSKYPCGTLFEGTQTIGTFVTACGAAASANTLYFPWMPGTSAAGWWGGYVITNFGSTAGTIKLTYADSDGKTATYTTASIPAKSQWNAASITFASLTDVDGFNSAKNYSVKAECGFTANGFAFTGNGTEGTGYTADK